MLSGKYASCSGEIQDPMHSLSVEEIGKRLQKHGFQKYGDEQLFDGRTGIPMKCKTFIGCIFYQRLRHLVKDKVYARNSDGPRSALTQQPSSGRSRGGGLRFGEMECVATASAGASKLLNTLLKQSDKSIYNICEHCGAFNSKHHKDCAMCKHRIVRQVIEVPYAFKLLMQELRMMGIQTKLK